MRTKLAVLTAAALAAGALSSQAQSNVYSLNVVGYVSIGLTNGFNMIANPLDLDGTGTNNTIVGVFSNSLPGGSTIYKFSGGGFGSSYAYSTRSGWSGNASLNPGEGVFASVPSNTSFTFVGQVLQGSQTNHNVVPGFSLVGSIIPLSGGFQTTMGWAPITGDTLYFYSQALSGGSGGYSSYAYSARAGGWAPSEPQIAPGVGFFLSTTQSSWVENFTVQ